jgi:hypothetical protein
VGPRRGVDVMAKTKIHTPAGTRTPVVLVHNLYMPLLEQMGTKCTWCTHVVYITKACVPE